MCSPRGDRRAFDRACADHTLEGAPYEITDIRLEDEVTAVAIIEVIGIKVPVHAYYEDGQRLTSLNDAKRSGAKHWLKAGKCAAAS